MTQNVSFAFFGSSQLSVYVLEELKRAGYIPKTIVTTPDKPQGRKLIITPTVVKTWAQRNLDPHTLIYSPEKLDVQFTEILKKESYDLFIVASYGKIIPDEVINIPTHKTLNVHPSLLPKYRGATPLQSAMLDDTKNTGVTIMCIDAKMDHGPIVAQKEISVTEWSTYEVFEEMMARTGGALLAEIIPRWISGTITAREQDHTQATFTKKIIKEDGLLNLTDDPYLNFRKIQAYHEWPKGFFMIEHAGKSIRVKVTSASFKENTLIIEKVIPEGGKEMSYKDFQSGYRS